MMKTDVFERSGADTMTRNAFYFVMGCVLSWGFVVTYIVSSMTMHWQPGLFEFLLVGLGLPLRVRGSSWRKARNKRMLRSVIEPSAVPKEEYAKAIISTKINLGINSAQSRNLSSGRTFEIPAAGGFLLAQRTIEHQSFYNEGREAEFFGSAEELVDKARYYLKHDTKREKIAVAGHERCMASGYSWQELMVGLVKSVEDACLK